MHQEHKPSSNEPLVVVDQLTKAYGDFFAMRDCSLTIPCGQVFGLLGPNGAGKSTLLRLLLGFLRPTSGRARIGGFDCYRQRLAAHRLLSYLPGDPRLFRTMSGKQVLKFFSQVRPDCDYQRSLRIAERLDLNLSRWVLLMSTGMRQKLAIAAVLAVEQPLLVLDEPTTNLDPTVRGVVLEMIREAQQAGRTVIFSSHVLSEIEEVCDRVIILRRGQLVHDQSISDLMRQHRVIAVPTAPLPDPPSEMAATISIRKLDDQRIQIDSPDSLHSLLRWLSDCPLRDVQIQPIGLRAIYDRFHSEEEAKDV